MHNVNPAPPLIQWKQLDKTISSLTPQDYLAVNRHSMAESLLTQAQVDVTYRWLPTTALLLTMAVYSIYDHGASIATLSHAGLHIVTLALLVFSSVSGRRQALQNTPIYMIIYAIYYLVVIHFISDFSLMNVLVGGLYAIFVWVYQNRHRRYQAVSSLTMPEIAKSTHDALVIALSQSEPNATNKLISIRENTQSLVIWLRPQMAIIYLSDANRIYLDVKHSLELAIAGKDMGGDRVSVSARIDSDYRVGSISRHGWLRYTQYRY